MAKENPKRIYGRRQGRPLNTSRKRVLDDLLPLLSLPAEKLKENGTLDPASLFSQGYEKNFLEIGFGNGEHLAALLRRHPENAYLGAEPFINGMAAFLKEISQNSLKEPPLPSGERVGVRGKAKEHPHPGPPPQRGGDCLKNIRVLMDDAMMLVHSLEDACLDGIYILNPDPWPKKRHHKRRIVNQNNLEAFARILKPGGILTMTTDVDDLAEWMLTQATLHPAFHWTARCGSDWKNPPQDWTKTRYEQKGSAAGRKQTYLIFKKTV